MVGDTGAPSKDIEIVLVFTVVVVPSVNCAATVGFGLTPISLGTGSKRLT